MGRPLLPLIVLLVCAPAITLSDASFSSGAANPGNTVSTAQSFCPTPGTVTLDANRDSYVIEPNPNQNNGSSSSLQVSPGVTLGLLGVQRTVVGFPLGQVSSLCTVTGATLRLYATGSSGSRTIGVHQLNGSWTEGGVTWNNLPATTGSAVTAGSGSGWRTWGVLTQVGAMIAGTNNGFLVRDQNESPLLNLTSQTYQSREGATDSQDPELVLTLE